MAHLGHKIPWHILDESITLEQYQLANPYSLPNHTRYRARFKDDSSRKALEHFCRKFSQIIAEFADTDKTSAEDKQKYDLQHWETEHDYPIYNQQGFLLYPGGSFDSVVGGYVLLNLLFMDGERYGKIINLGSGYAQRWLLGACVGRCPHFWHPEWLAECIQPLMQMDGHQRCSGLKPLDREMTAQLRDYLATLFKIMYSTTNCRTLFSPEAISKTVRYCCLDMSYKH